jgi:hypothetical protein
VQVGHFGKVPKRLDAALHSLVAQTHVRDVAISIAVPAWQPPACIHRIGPRKGLERHLTPAMRAAGGAQLFEYLRCTSYVAGMHAASNLSELHLVT